VRDQQLALLVDEMKKMFTTIVLKPLDKILESIPDDMWSRVRQLYSDGKNLILDKFTQRLTGFEVSKEEEEKRIKDVNATAFSALKDKMKERAKYLNYLMNKKFEEKFKLDERKLPRRWKPTDDIAHIFMEARQSAELLLETFCLLRLQEDLDSLHYLDPESKESVDESLVIISLDEAHTIHDKFYKETESTYLQALRDQENVNSAAHVPMYVLLLIIILGFNEFLMVLQNPLLLILLIVIGIAGYIIYILGMGGPFRRVLESVLQTSLSTFQTYLSAQLHHSKNKDQVEMTENPKRETKKDK